MGRLYRQNTTIAISTAATETITLMIRLNFFMVSPLISFFFQLTMHFFFFLSLHLSDLTRSRVV